MKSSFQSNNALDDAGSDSCAEVRATSHSTGEMVPRHDFVLREICMPVTSGRDDHEDKAQ